MAKPPAKTMMDRQWQGAHRPQEGTLLSSSGRTAGPALHLYSVRAPEDDLSCNIDRFDQPCLMLTTKA
jgi:hypothetical protein